MTTITLQRPDGSPLRVHVARPNSTGPGVVVLHAWWGLAGDSTAVCDHLATEGFLAAAPDLFGGRTADTVEEATRLVRDVTGGWCAEPPDEIVQTVVRWLREQPDLYPSRIGLLGFSLGGGVAIVSAAAGIGDAVVTFYGMPAADRLNGVKCPVLGHFAETDEYEPRDAVEAAFAQLRRQGVQATHVTYPGMRHWFSEPSRPEYDADAAARAWSATLSFLRTHLA